MSVMIQHSSLGGLNGAAIPLSALLNFSTKDSAFSFEENTAQGYLSSWLPIITIQILISHLIKNGGAMIWLLVRTDGLSALRTKSYSTLTCGAATLDWS